MLLFLSLLYLTNVTLLSKTLNNVKSYRTHSWVNGSADNHLSYKHEDRSADLQGPYRKLGDVVLCLLWGWAGAGQDQRRIQADPENIMDQLAWSTRCSSRPV